MQTKFYFLLGMLVGLTSVSSTSVAQTACFGYDSGDQAPDGFQLHVETFATFDGTESSPEVAALAGSTTYRIYLETPSAADYVSRVSTNGESGIVELTTSTSFYMNEFGGLTVNDINPGLFAFFPELEYDSYVTIGLDSEAEGAQSSILLSGEASWSSSFLAGGNLSINGANSSDGDGWSVPSGATNGFAGDDNMVMLAQVTTDGNLNGSLYVDYIPDGAGPTSFQFSFSNELCGCTDPEADSYEATATLDDGSCIYLGCTDATACNYDAGSNEDDGSCDYCCLTVVSENDAYGLELDLHNPSGIPGLRTYRLYVTTENATDAISAVTGLTETTPLEVNTTTEFFQWQGGGGGVTPNFWNPMFGTLPGFEQGAFDSYVTIGLTESANLDAGEYAVEVVEDLATGANSDPWIADFEAGGNISTSNAAGGGWFMFPGYTNAIAGDDNRVLIGQFTTDGLMSGGMFVQIFPEGDQNQSIEFYMTFSAPACACTDETACNYDEDALWDDGSCQDGPAYWGENITCDGQCLNDADGDYVCDEDEIAGCLNEAACNYVPAGTVTDLVTCEFPEEGLTCDGDCINDVDNDGVCDEFELGGCTDSSACNYDSTATEENGTCTYLESITFGEGQEGIVYDCDNVCYNDEDGDGTCDELEVLGCTDESACNYDASFTEEDGSCDYCCAATASVEGYNIAIEAVQETADGTQYRMYVETPNATDKLSAVVGDAINPSYILSTQPIYRSGVNTDVTANVVNPAFFAIFPSLEWDSWVTIGIDNFMVSAGESLISTIESTEWVADFNAGNGITMEGEFGDGWYVLPDVTNGLSGDDGRVLVGQFTTHGILSGQIFVQMFPEGDANNAIAVHLPFGYASDDSDAPVFTYVPGDMSQNCSDAYPTEMATAVDEGCFPDASVEVSEEITEADCGYTLTRTFTATDAFGNVAIATQVVQLLDSESPVAVAQVDFSAQCTDDLTPGAGVAEFPTQSYDNCANASDLEFSYADAPYSPGFDLTGATADFNVEMGFNFGGPFGASLELAASDVTIGDGAELTYDDMVSNPASHRGAVTVDIDGSMINLSVAGTNGFPFSYDYAHVNITNISLDNIAAVTINTNGIGDGAEISVSTTNNSISISWTGTAIYSEGDAASASVDSPSTCLENPGVMRTWTVTDNCGNAGSAVQYITIIDTEGPVFTSTPQNIELSCNDEIPMATLSAEDCSAVSISAPMDVISDGSCGISYTIHRTWSASDACGNTSEHTQTIMVTDVVAPAFTSFPADVTYTSGDDVQDEMPTASDDCNEVSIDFVDATDNSNVEITVITRTWTATDACGNSTSQDQIITVNEVLGCMDDLACNYNASASYDDGSCDFCSCGSGGEAGFGLELELVETQDGSIDGLSAGMSTYRVYVTTPTADDFVSSVSGDINNPSFLQTTTSFYQDPFGGITPDNINPLFFTVVPSLNYDSWLTIGIDGVAGAGESAITVVQAPADDWMNTFNAGGNLEMNSFFGGSWFALITSSNGFAGEDQRVLVAQLTTDGDISGQLYVQVFPNGEQSQDTYLSLSFGGNECGCLDATACNYSTEATYDDGSCAYPELGYDCEGNCTGDSDEDGVCDDLEIFGCTIEGNCNYDPAATELDESMCQVSPFCIGCNDEAACNFNPNVFPAPNFNDGSCTYPEEGFDCEGDCLDMNGDLICDILQGCGDESACNYTAGVEYPSLDFCDFCSCLNVASSHEGYGIEVESMMSDVEGATTYHVYVATANSTDVLNAILGNAENPIILASSSEIYQSGQGSYLPSSPELFAFYPLLASDSYVTIGDMTPASVINLPPTANGSAPTWVTDFEGGGNIAIDDVIGSGWYINADYMGEDYGLAGDDNRVLVAQITTPGTIHGELFVQIFPEGLSAGNTIYVSLSFGSDNCGCADETACNYSEENYEDDGSCFYPIEGEGCNECLYDEQSPVLIATEDYTTECSNVDSDIRQPLVEDECDNVLDVDYVDALTSGTCDGSYTITRTWTFADNAMNSISVVQVISVVDTSAPTFSVPENVAVACTDDINDLTVTGDVIDAADACSMSVTVSYADSDGDSNCFDGDVIVRTWTATDDCGNASSADQVISLVDDVAPYFTSVPADVDLECGDDLPMDMATAEDVCSGATVTFADMEGDANCTGMAVITRTFTATDACGNSSTATQMIARSDAEAPTGTVSDESMSCEAYDASAEYGSVTSSDNCMSMVVATWEQLSSTQEGSNGCFVVEREYTFTDGCGNSSTAIQTITVTDDVAPVMDEVAAAVELQCGDAMPTVPGATDNCSAVEVTFEDVETTMGCSGEMNFIRTYTATDACGNAVSATQEVTFNDSIAPTFTVPADVTVECDTDLSDGAFTGDVVDAADVCSSGIFVTFNDTFSTSEGSCLADNVVTRTWTVTDGCGNVASDVQIITLEDTTAPVVTYEANITLYDSASENIDDFEGISEVFDACSDYTYTTTDLYSGSGIYSYQLNRTMVFTDACGNSTTIEQLVTAIYSTGCTYEDAMNFDAAAIIDDGSCLYEGCTDMASANYNPIASVDDGSCVTVGCMDPAGYDFDPNANFPGGCDYPDPCPGDINDDGMVNVSDLLEFFQLYGMDCPE